MSNPYAAPTPDNNHDVETTAPTTSAQAQPSASETAYEQPQYGQAAPQPEYAHSAPQTPYGQPQYGQPQYGYTQPIYTTPSPNYVDVESLKSNATIAFILSLLGIIGIIPFIGPIIGWVWGSSIVNKAIAAGIPVEAVQQAKWAKILGIIGVALWTFLIILLIVFTFIFIVTFASHAPMWMH
ncbi:hypothetical protein [Schaalia sp. lx-260]|uniref:hypothetical protein n=1 Tax=Schaalia sp. lx-260 TaxID=2899082 RepID=UPI001E517808|nr:hypothetical protein [Schaalia sp. lx-260]MCD4550009.1 hypothetical protein [Schaalia sp. lx-260]